MEGENKVFLKCVKCPFTTLWNFSLYGHVKNSHCRFKGNSFSCNLAFIEQFLCPQCNFETHLTVDFINHLRRGHDDLEFPEQINLAQWKCQDCVFKTFSRFLAQAHSCTKNEREEDTKDNELLELKDHSYFKTEQVSYLQKDVKSKWFKCDHCSYESIYKRNLKQHESTQHTPDDEIRWFRCDYCSHKSSQKSNLKTHIMNIHTPEKRKFYVCDHCSYKTKLKYCLKNHVETYHPLGPEVTWFSCDNCEYGSNYRHDVEVHNKNCHKFNEMGDYTAIEEGKWFICDLCSFKSKYLGNFRCHVKRVHKSHDHVDIVPTVRTIHLKKTIEEVITRPKQENLPNLNVHVMKHHDNEESWKWIKCDRCNYKTICESRMTWHLNCEHSMKDG